MSRGSRLKTQRERKGARLQPQGWAASPRSLDQWPAARQVRPVHCRDRITRENRGRARRARVEGAGDQSSSEERGEGPPLLIIALCFPPPMASDAPAAPHAHLHELNPGPIKPLARSPMPSDAPERGEAVVRREEVGVFSAELLGSPQGDAREAPRPRCGPERWGRGGGSKQGERWGSSKAVYMVKIELNVATKQSFSNCEGELPARLRRRASSERVRADERGAGANSFQRVCPHQRNARLGRRQQMVVQPLDAVDVQEPIRARHADAVLLAPRNSFRGSPSRR